MFLAQQGFQVTGVDFVPQALENAAARAAAAKVADSTRWMRQDMYKVPALEPAPSDAQDNILSDSTETIAAAKTLGGPFDFVVDHMVSRY